MKNKMNILCLQKHLFLRRWYNRVCRFFFLCFMSSSSSCLLTIRLWRHNYIKTIKYSKIFNDTGYLLQSRTIRTQVFFTGNSSVSSPVVMVMKSYSKVAHYIFELHFDLNF